MFRSGSVGMNDAGIASERLQKFEWYTFDEEEKELLRNTWELIQLNLEDFGIAIYEMIFEQCPESRNLFPYMRFTPDGKERKNVKFTSQALRFVEVFQMAIDSLHDLESMDATLDNLGRMHGRLDNLWRFEDYYWSVFLECAIYNIRKFIGHIKAKKRHTFDETTLDSAIILWRRLISGIVDRVERGFQKDLANRKKSTETVSGSFGRGWLCYAAPNRVRSGQISVDQMREDCRRLPRCREKNEEK